MKQMGKLEDLENRVGDLNRHIKELEENATMHEAEIGELRAALATAIKVAGEARKIWDEAPSGMKAGKLLIALSDPTLSYREDISEMHRVNG